MNRPASREQADTIEKSEIGKEMENVEQEIEELTEFPEDPDNEDLFRNNLIVTEEEDQEGTENAPLAQDLENGYYKEAGNAGIDDLALNGEDQDDYYEQLGHKAERNANTLDKETYQSIPKGR